MTIFISAFPGVGKSTVYNALKDKFAIADSDSSAFNKDRFPENYVQHLKALQVKNEHAIVFVSSHQNVRETMDAYNIPYVVVYPTNCEEAKAEYLRRYAERGSPPAFIQLLDNNWDAFIASCEDHGKAVARLGLKPEHTMVDALKVLSEIMYPQLKEIVDACQETRN